MPSTHIIHVMYVRSLSAVPAWQARAPDLLIMQDSEVDAGCAEDRWHYTPPRMHALAFREERCWFCVCGERRDPHAGKGGRDNMESREAKDLSSPLALLEQHCARTIASIPHDKYTVTTDEETGSSCIDQCASRICMGTHYRIHVIFYLLTYVYISLSSHLCSLPTGEGCRCDPKTDPGAPAENAKQHKHAIPHTRPTSSTASSSSTAAAAAALRYRHVRHSSADPGEGAGHERKVQAQQTRVQPRESARKSACIEIRWLCGLLLFCFPASPFLWH